MKSLFFTLLLGVAVLLSAADVTGKYKASIEAPDGVHALVFDLKANGSALTGTVTDSTATARQIQDGKVQGDTVTFTWTTDYQGSAVKLVCRGQLADGDLKLNMGTDDGSWSTDLTAKKTN